MKFFNVDKNQFDRFWAVKTRTARGNYPFDLVEVGQGFFCPLDQYRECRGADRTMKQLYNSLYQAAYRRKDKRFTIFQDGPGYTVIRLD